MARQEHALGRVWFAQSQHASRDKESNCAMDPLSILPQITSGTLHTPERCLFSFFVSHLLFYITFYNRQILVIFNRIQNLSPSTKSFFFLSLFIKIHIYYHYYNQCYCFRWLNIIIISSYSYLNQFEWFSPVSRITAFFGFLQ